MAICSFNLRILARCSGGSSWIWSSVKLNTCIISAACSGKEKVCVYVWVGRYEVNTMLQPIRLPAYWPNCMVGDFVGNCRTSFLEENSSFMWCGVWVYVHIGNHYIVPQNACVTKYYKPGQSLIDKSTEREESKPWGKKSGVQLRFELKTS